jgi:hypothetical protein
MLGGVSTPGAGNTAGTWNMQGGRMVIDGRPLTAGGFQHGELYGASFTWHIRGTPGDDEILAGGTGGTTFDALAGDDAFAGSEFADVFDGGPGTDHSVQMLDGADTCISVEILDAPDCESVIPWAPSAQELTAKRP